jgi:UDP-N-acetyl-D-glucosamine dehydrogenase
MTNLTPNSSFSVTLRLQIPNRVGMLASVTQAIASTGGNLGQIDLIEQTREESIRDITVDAASTEHAETIVQSVKELSDIKVIDVYDRTFNLHRGGKISIVSRIPLKSVSDLAMAYTPGVGRICKAIAENIKNPVLVINESTSFPGTIRNFIKPLIEKLSASKVEHLYAISPERVDPGRVDWDQKNTPRLYAGLTPEASRQTRDFYSSFCDNLVEVSSPEVAEAAKLFENTFRQVNIALVNEFAQIAHALGISVHETLEAANTKPYGFMKFSPSAGVGGHCIPVDPSYLAHVAEGLGVPATFIERANEVNLEMPKYVVARVAADNGGSLSGKSVQVIGISYKPNVADTRETPAELVIEELKRQGAKVTWHDAVVGTWHGQESSALGGSEIAIVVTLHDAVDKKAVLASAPYVFDTTGKLTGAKGL